MSQSQSNKKPLRPQVLVEPVLLPCAVALKEVVDAYVAASIVQHPNHHHFLTQIRTRAVDAMLRRLSMGTLLARSSDFELFCDGGYIPAVGNDGIIPKQFWAYVRRFCRHDHQDWLSGDFMVECMQDRQFVAGHAIAVRFDRSGLPLINEQVVAGPAITVKHARGGAPRKWDWDRALAHLVAVAHCSSDGLLRNDGSEPNQSDIARRLGDWFIGSCGDCPENSQLRQHGKRVEQEINALKLLHANNRKVA